MNFSKNLKELMLKNNIRNIDLANKLQINKSTITLYLKGEREPNFLILEQIKNVLQCTYDELLE